MCITNVYRGMECHECGATVTRVQGLGVCQECGTTVEADDVRLEDR